jgi:Uma2 family endonuclease
MTNHSTAGDMMRHARPYSAEETGAMHMAIKTHVWSRRDLERLPDDGNKYEVVRGELFVTPAPSPRHQGIVIALAERLAPYVSANSLGHLDYPRSAVVLDEDEVEPDLMVRPRMSPAPERWEDVPLPILVVEVLSDTTRRRDLISKRALYADAGVPEYWMVDPRTRSITVARPNVADVVETRLLRWHPPVADARLEIDVAELFREALGDSDISNGV